MAAREGRRPDEQRLFEERFLSVQPTLDQTSYKVWGQFPGSEGRTIEQALIHRADQFPVLPDGTRCSQAQARADALVSIAWDSLQGSQREGPSSAPVVAIFVDAREAARSNEETAAAIDVGPRVGPLTLEEILCDGRVEVLVTAQGRKATHSRTRDANDSAQVEAIHPPPRWRCLHRRRLPVPLSAPTSSHPAQIAGWNSRYRQPHHPM